MALALLDTAEGRRTFHFNFEARKWILTARLATLQKPKSDMW